MSGFFKSLRIFLAACLFAACTPARTGVIGNTLTTNVKPAISITGLAPLAIREHGRLLPESGPPSASGTASLTFDYAFFTDAEQLRDRFAYAAIVRITSDRHWRFQPPTVFDEAFSDGRGTLGGFAWSEQLLRIPGGGDWAAGVWEDLGGIRPEFWLVKRWICHLDDKARAVMEYREPWPAAIQVVSGKTLLATDDGDKALQVFLARAEAAFSVEKRAGKFEGDAPGPERKKNRIPPDIARLAGSVLRIQDN